MKPQTFQPSDLVLRKFLENTADPSAGKFQLNWEGPYIVTRADEFGSYALDKLDGTPVPRMWNVMHLKKVLSIKNDSISNFVPVSIFHYKAGVRLMSYRPSMVDAQLVHYKAWVRLMS